MRRIALCLAVGALLGPAGPARAATLVVGTTGDSSTANPPVGNCSIPPCALREAVTDANDEGLHPGPDTIQVPPGIYNLQNFDALPTITTDITIEGTGGAGVTTITGADTTSSTSPAGGVIAAGFGGKLTIRGVTISGNRIAGTASTTGGAIASETAPVVIERSVLRGNRSDAVPASNGVSGGAIGMNTAQLTISESAIEDNLFAGSSAVIAAGGIMQANGAGAGTTIARSSVSRNRVDPPSGTNGSVGGGVYASDGTALTITDSTVSRNSVAATASTFRAGGVLTINPAPSTDMTPATTLTNVTLTDNAAGTGATAYGNYAGFGGPEPKIIRNSIFAGGVPVNCRSQGSAIASGGGNLEDANDCNFTGPGDLVNTPPLLEALAAGGNGLGLAQRPLPASPALGRARPELCSATDQRGLARPQGAGCDSGAIETASAPVNTALPSISGTPANGQTLTCNPGTFAENPALAFQWLSDGAAISGATSATFTVTDAQLDTAVQCQVLATNVAGQVVATSAAVVPPKPPVVTPPAPPANTVRPTFTGVPRTGQKLTCSQGTFTGATSFAFAWLRNGEVVARAATYTLTAADAGKAIQCSVTATGPGGSVVADSAPVVSAKACIVPALTGQTLAAAKRTLTKANCALGRTTTRKSKKRKGTVISSSPAKGTNLAAGTKVALTLARK